SSLSLLVYAVACPYGQRHGARVCPSELDSFLRLTRQRCALTLRESVAAAQRIRLLVEEEPDLPLHAKSRLVAAPELPLEVASGDASAARAHELDCAEPQ